MALTPISFQCIRWEGSAGENSQLLQCSPLERKERQGREGLQPRSCCRLLARSRRLMVPRSRCQGAGAPAGPESQHGSVTKPNKSTFYQTPQLTSLPCPLLGTTWIWKLQYLLPMIKLFTWANNKKKTERAFASSTSPFSKDVDVIKCISCSSRGRLKLDFPHPYTEATVRNSCLPENGQTTHYSSTLMTELIHSPGHDADAQCRLPVLYPNNSAPYCPK